MKIYVVSEVYGDEIEVIKAFRKMDSAIEFINTISIMHQHDDVEFMINPVELEK